MAYTLDFSEYFNYDDLTTQLHGLADSSEMAALEACAMIRRVEVRGGAIETRRPS